MADFESKYSFAFDDSDEEDDSLLLTPVVKPTLKIEEKTDSPVKDQDNQNLNENLIKIDEIPTQIINQTKIIEEENKSESSLKFKTKEDIVIQEQQQQDIKQANTQEYSTMKWTEHIDINNNQQSDNISNENFFHIPQQQQKDKHIQQEHIKIEQLNKMSNDDLQRLDSEVIMASLLPEHNELQSQFSISDIPSTFSPQRQSPSFQYEQIVEQEQIQQPIKAQTQQVQLIEANEEQVKPIVADWLQQKDQLVDKFFQDLLSDSEDSDNDELINTIPFNKPSQPFQQQISVQEEKFDLIEETPIFEKQVIDFKSESNQIVEQNVQEDRNEEQQIIQVQQTESFVPLHHEVFYQHQDSRNIEQVLILNQENSIEQQDDEFHYSSQQQVYQMQEDELENIEQQKSFNVFHDQQDSNILQSPQKIELQVQEQHPQNQLNQAYTNIFENEEELQISFQPFSNVIHVSDIKATNQYPQEEQQLHQNKPKETNFERPTFKQFANFSKFDNTLNIITNKQILKKIQYKTDFEMNLIKLLSPFLHMDYSKFNSSKANLVQQIQLLLGIKSEIPQKQKVTWTILQSLINISSLYQKKGMSDLLLIDNYYMTGQRNIIIEELSNGISLSQFMDEINLKKDVDLNFNLGLERIGFGQAFDYDKGIKYDTFVEQLITRDQWSDALMFSSLFCKKEDQNKIYAQYINKFYSPKHPLYTLLMITTNQIDKFFANNNQVQQVLSNWEIQVAFLLKNLDFIPDKINLVKQFLKQLSNEILLTKQDVWGFIQVRMLIGDWKLGTILNNTFNSWKMDISLNYLLSILENLSEQNQRNKVELSFYRSHIYLNGFGLYEKAHEELHQVIENRDNLDIKIQKSQYFQFYMREQKQLAYDLMRGVKQQPIKQSQTNIQPIKQVQNSDERKQEETPTQQEGLLTGFKGLFRRVIDQAQTTIATTVNQPKIVEKSQEFAPSIKEEKKVDLIQSKEFENSLPIQEQQVEIKQEEVIVQPILDQLLQQPVKQLVQQPRPQIPQPRFQPPRNARPTMFRQPPLFQPPVQKQQIPQQQNQELSKDEIQIQQKPKEEVKEEPPVSKAQNPFGIMPKGVSAGNQNRPRGKVMYASLLHHSEDSQKQKTSSTDLPPI